DFRRGYGPDCDFVYKRYPDLRWDCLKRPEEKLPADQMNVYLSGAWDDFLAEQIKPFGSLPVFLGIGNHELAGNWMRDDFRRKFQRWFTSAPIHLQRVQEGRREQSPFFSTEGATDYDFVLNGINFIYLDNADLQGFSPAQLDWLRKVVTYARASRSSTAMPWR